MSNLNKLPLIQQLNAAPVSKIADLQPVVDKFQHLYSVMHGSNAAAAAIKYEAEKFHFNKLLSDNPKLAACTKLSLYGCFIDMAVNGLSFDPALKHAYLVPQGFRLSPKGVKPEQWEQRATLMISGYGELLLRQQQGQIKYADNPVCVYEGDEFTYGTTKGEIFLEHKAKFPRTSENIIACYVRIERADSSIDYKVLSIGEIEKLQAQSKQPDAPSWSENLRGMIEAKTIKHAFRSYPKVKLGGNFTKVQTDQLEAPVAAPLIDYGIEEAFTPHTEVKEISQPQQTAAPAKDDFPEAPPTTAQEIKYKDDDF